MPSILSFLLIFYYVEVPTTIRSFALVGQLCFQFFFLLTIKNESWPPAAQPFSSFSNPPPPPPVPRLSLSLFSSSTSSVLCLFLVRHEKVNDSGAEQEYWLLALESQSWAWSSMVTKWMGDCYVLGFTAWGQLLWTVQTQQKFFWWEY